MGQPLAPDSTILQLLKMDSKLVFPLAVLVLLGLVAPGSGLMCHQCNSYENALCADPFSHEDGQVKSNDEFLKECGDEQDYTMCRKVYQNVRDEVRVIRSCGWIPDSRNRECYTTVLEEYNTEVHLRLRRLQLRQPELDVCDGGSVLGGAGLPAALEAHSQDGAAETLATLA